jgi:hypothetical protein
MYFNVFYLLLHVSSHSSSHCDSFRSDASYSSYRIATVWKEHFRVTHGCATDVLLVRVVAFAPNVDVCSYSNFYFVDFGLFLSSCVCLFICFLFMFLFDTISLCNVYSMNCV